LSIDPRLLLFSFFLIIENERIFPSDGNKKIEDYFFDNRLSWQLTTNSIQMTDDVILNSLKPPKLYLFFNQFGL
jgi:hypothetical protein